MVRCARCCLQNSMRVANILVNLFGVAMIIYSLWLIKEWKLGVADLPTVSSIIPQPWFIYACLGVGIAICLNTICGHTAANCINNSIFCFYIFSICSLLFLEIAVVFTIFFRINWDVQLAKYIDKNHANFKAFVLWHLTMCRLAIIIAMVPQINVIVLAVVLWSVGTEPRSHIGYMDVPDFRQSFLIGPTTPTPVIPEQTCRSCLFPYRQYQTLRSFPDIRSVLRMLFRRRDIT